MPLVQPKYRPVLPDSPRPICIIGAGSIVRDAHLPAYAMAGFPVAGIADINLGAAKALAEKFGIAQVTRDVDELIAVAPAEAVFDLALPASLFPGMLEKLPDGAAVLIQKPMGETIGEAQRILSICRRKNLLAAVNLQLRFAPFVMAAKDLIGRGAIGSVRDMEVRITVSTPWDHFAFLKDVARLEIIYHSIHHLDCVRHFLGNPKGIHAKTLTYPELPMPDSRSAIILDYGESVRANIQTNHFHAYGPRHQESYLKWEGTKGAIKAKMGLLMNYPDGVPDCFEVCQLEADGKPGPWREIKLEGSWFPHAFVGAMAQVMRAADGEQGALVTPVEDTLHTMACCEAAYASSRRGGIDPMEFIAQRQTHP